MADRAEGQNDSLRSAPVSIVDMLMGLDSMSPRACQVTRSWVCGLRAPAETPDTLWPANVARKCHLSKWTKQEPMAEQNGNSTTHA